jgi:drug/metabolite transporter (DMT)-like permease
VVGALLGWLVLREPDPGRRLLGTGLVVAGIALMAVG